MTGRLPRHPDPYQVLGITRDASSSDISRAYRRLARELHPDSRPADIGAPDQFRAISAAYQLLSDPVSREAYDQLAGHDLASAAGPASPWASRSEPESQIRPLGPARWSPDISPPPAAGVRPGPVRIEPLPGSASPADEEAIWLADLLRRISQHARRERYRTW